MKNKFHLPNQISYPLMRFFIQWQETNRGLLMFNWAIRSTMIIFLTAYFVVKKDTFPVQHLSMIRFWLMAFFAYDVITAFLGFIHNDLFLMKRVKLLQVGIEIIVYSIFYYYSRDILFELWFLLLLGPLYVTARYLNAHLRIVVAGFAMLCTTLVFQSLSPNVLGDNFWITLISKNIYIAGVIFLFSMRAPASIVQDLQQEGTQLANLFGNHADGMFLLDNNLNLLFVNDFLQKIHGERYLGHSCKSYFHSIKEFPEKSSISKDTENPLTVFKKYTDEFIDLNGNLYPVEITPQPIFDESNILSGILVTVHNLEKEKEYNQQISDYMEKNKSLFAEREKWLNTLLEISKRLSGFDSQAELMEYIVSETKNLLSAESCNIFLLGGGCLCIKASNPFVLNDERYCEGDGITGKVIIPNPGSKYGQAICSNNVDRDARVNPAYLKIYEEKLPSHQVNHLLAVPINGYEGSIGTLRVINRLDHKGRLLKNGFSQDDMDYLMSIASMVAIALENTNLLNQKSQQIEAMERLNEIKDNQNRQLSTVYRVVQDISKEMDMHELLQAIVLAAHNTIPNSRKVSIHLIHDQCFVDEARFPDTPKNLLPPMSKAEGISGQAINRRNLVYIPDTRLDSDFTIRGEQNPISLMVCPLIINNDILGTISVDGDEAEAFPYESHDLLRTLATHAAITIKKSQIYERERDGKELANKLLRASSALNQELDIRHIYQASLKAIKDFIDFDSISIQLIDESGKELKVVECAGFDHCEKVQRLKFPFNDQKFPNFYVMKEKSGYIVEDVREDFPHFFRERQRYGSGKIRSWMGIPLLRHDKIIGMIAIDKWKPGFFTREMLPTVQTYANQVATAIEHAKLYQKAQQDIVTINCLVNISAGLIQFNQTQKLYQYIVSQASDLFKAKASCLYLWNEAQKTPLLVASNPGYSEDMNRLYFTLVKETAQSNQVLDLNNKKLILEKLSALGVTDNNHAGVRSRSTAPLTNLTAVSLMGNNKITGVLLLGDRQPFSDFENKVSAD